MWDATPLRDLEEEGVDRNRYRSGAVGIEETSSGEVGVPLVGHPVGEVGVVRRIVRREDAGKGVADRNEMRVVAKIGTEAQHRSRCGSGRQDEIAPVDAVRALLEMRHPSSAIAAPGQLLVEKPDSAIAGDRQP